jgi:hypothetical protein
MPRAKSSHIQRLANAKFHDLQKSVEKHNRKYWPSIQGRLTPSFLAGSTDQLLFRFLLTFDSHLLLVDCPWFEPENLDPYSMELRVVQSLHNLNIQDVPILYMLLELHTLSLLYIISLFQGSHVDDTQQVNHLMSISTGMAVDSPQALNPTTDPESSNLGAPT